MQKYWSVLLLLLSATVTQSSKAQELLLSGSKTNSLISKDVIQDFRHLSLERRTNDNVDKMTEFTLAAGQIENIASVIEVTLRLKVAKLDGQLLIPARRKSIHTITIDNQFPESMKFNESKNLFRTLESVNKK